MCPGLDHFSHLNLNKVFVHNLSVLYNTNLSLFNTNFLVEYATFQSTDDVAAHILKELSDRSIDMELSVNNLGNAMINITITNRVNYVEYPTV